MAIFIDNQNRVQAFAMAKYRYEQARQLGNQERMVYWDKKMDELMGIEDTMPPLNTEDV